MKAIILAGGGGTRLWPISRSNSPKQVESILGNKTMLDSCYTRLRQTFAAEDILVTTSVNSADTVRGIIGDELPQENILLEPCRRETAGAIGFAVTKIAAKNPDEVFVVINSDVHVKDDAEYHRVIRAAGQTVQAHPDHTIIIGIPPEYPETGYGYINHDTEVFTETVQDAKTYSIRKIKRFVEKPDLETAKTYLADGNYFWNPTLIVARAGSFMKAFERHLPDNAALFNTIGAAFGTADEQQVINECFPRLSSISIDYGILEKECDMLTIPGIFGWADVGHWRTVHEILARDKKDNVVRGKHIGVESEGNLIISSSGKLIATAGVTDMVIIETDDAILVCAKDKAQYVKNLVANLKEDEDLMKYL